MSPQQVCDDEYRREQASYVLRGAGWVALFVGSFCAGGVMVGLLALPWLLA